MSFKSGRVLDGYALVTGSNSFVVPWLDVHSSPFFNISMVFSSAAVDGYATLEQSNDREAIWTNGQNYPASAQFVGTYGKGPLGDPLDLSTVVGSSRETNSANSPFVSGLPGVVYSAPQTTSRFVRIKYVATVNVATTVTCTFSWKSTS